MNDERPHIRGVGRDTSDESGRSMLAYFDRPLSDDEMRSFHDYLREWRPDKESGE